MSAGIAYKSKLGKQFEFRVPTLKEWDEFEAQRDENIGVANRQLLQSTCIAGGEELHAHFERFPASIIPLVEKLKGPAGDSIPVTVEGSEADGFFVVTSTRAGLPLRFSCPTLAQFEMYQERFRKISRPAIRELAAMTLVDTPVDTLTKHFEDAPYAQVTLGEALAQLAGGDLEVTVKKG